jgi:hypothetical protein
MIVIGNILKRIKRKEKRNDFLGEKVDTVTPMYILSSGKSDKKIKNILKKLLAI